MHQAGAQSYDSFLSGIKERIRTAQVKAVLAANAELILPYWEIGRDILANQDRQGWGAKVIDRLSADLQRDFPKLRGYSVRNLKYMRAFAEAWPDRTIVQQLGAQIPWKHNCLLLDRVKDKATRTFYIQSTIQHGWARSVLTHQIDTKLHARLGAAPTNFALTLPAPESDLAREMLKDPYVFRPAPLDEKANERALEDALIARLKDFLLELGSGFAFVGNQVRLEVAGDDFFIDLLFYHTRLHCYKALAIYGKGKDGVAPLRDKALLVEQLRQALRDALQFCDNHGVSIGRIEQATAGSLERLNLPAYAVNVLISPDPIRKEFLGHERLVATLYKAVMPDKAVIEFSSPVSCISMLAVVIREQLGEGPADISSVMGKIAALLDESIAADGFRIRESPPDAPGANRVIDLSAIDFEVLAKRFSKSKQKNVDLERLKAAIQAQLDKMIRLNHTRADFRKKFEELIELYNAGSRNIEELFEDLLNLSRALTDEQQRHVREHLSEAELTVFDLLTRPGPELTTEEMDAVKKVARLLLERLRQVLVLDWRKRQSSRAQVEDTIKGLLDENLPRAYSPEIYRSKCEAIFHHVFESYRGEGESIFSEVA